MRIALGVVTFASLLANAVLWSRLSAERPIRHVRPSRPCAHADRETADAPRLPAAGTRRDVETRTETARSDSASAREPASDAAPPEVSIDVVEGPLANTTLPFRGNGNAVFFSGVWETPTSEPPLAVLEREVGLTPAQREWIEQAIQSQLDYEQREKYEKLKKGEMRLGAFTTETMNELWKIDGTSGATVRLDPANVLFFRAMTTVGGGR
ncbi:MAG: hypothetical protein HYY17_03450 [Planctomycetes bacterium]|nr:hypothetical protein [Planctomycetota bacterium]